MPSGLPGTGPISSSQVGVYAFDRGSTAEFSLSASLAGTTVNKGYTTALGPLWRGTGTGDTDNQQYNQGANNFSLSDWHSYSKGFMINISAKYRDNPDGACADETENDVLYITDGIYWNTTSGANIFNDQTICYTNTSGTAVCAENNVDWFQVFEMNAAYVINSVGQFTSEYPCP